MTKKIFIIDRQQEILDSAETAFTRMGFQVSGYLATKEALLDWEAGDRLGCLVFEWDTRNGASAALLKTARERDETLPIVILGNTEPTEARALLRSPGAAMVKKPFRMVALVEAVTEAIASVGRGDEI